MAYVSKELKKAKLEKIKPVLKKFGLKGSLSVSNHSTLVLTISEGKIDFIDNFNKTCGANHSYLARGWKPQKDYIGVNHYWYQDHFVGTALKALKELIDVLFEGHWDESDIQSDYFHTAYYVDVKIGKWDKPYKLSA